MGNFTPAPKDWFQFLLVVAASVGAVYLLDRYVNTLASIVVAVVAALVLVPVAILLFAGAAAARKP